MTLPIDSIMVQPTVARPPATPMPAMTAATGTQITRIARATRNAVEIVARAIGFPSEACLCASHLATGEIFELFLDLLGGLLRAVDRVQPPAVTGDEEVGCMQCHRA